MSFAHLSLCFILGSLALFAVALRVRGVRLRDIAPAAGLTLAVLLVLTAVFDNVMIGSGLFDYNSQTLLGIRVGLAPLEDFSYPFCAALVVPALWWLAGGSHSGATPKPTSPHDSGKEG
ncbi:lycopene cyclase domain-containing protein [Arthrobacter sp. AQ5-05]|uniref:lycopene cyclase domain-containing protein n=1 Tax=Arthrobacter sp. AQ5-05 TaxID=2184581 RepID=UPI000DCE7596|nr:lycopene cyclase domain-containing protein [Arthrobacter sp. AQ5-05]RAX49473.1 lycopene cyclase domain-containing protein [Arthrobacter sp. AQ5-05]